MPFDIVQQGRELWTKEQKKRVDKLIKRWNLKMFSYPAMQSYLVGEDENLAVVSEYAVGKGLIPIVRDVIKGDRCLADLDGQKLYQPPMPWNLWLVGSRKDDSHWSMNGQVIPSESWEVGDVEFYAPLYDYSRQDVIDGLTERGIDADEVGDEENTGNLLACTNCLNGTGTTWCPKDEKEIPVIRWSRSGNLAMFRNRFQVL